MVLSEHTQNLGPLQNLATRLSEGQYRRIWHILDALVITAPLCVILRFYLSR